VITETTITAGSEGAGADGRGLHLLVVSREGFGSQLLPAFGTVTIGRSSRCTVQLEDPMVSREHVRLHIMDDGGASAITVEDVGSANGTRLCEDSIGSGQERPLRLGDEVGLGTTILMVLDNRGPRHIRSHSYFEARVADECVRALKDGSTFALARLRFPRDTPWNKTLPALARGLDWPHVFAAYGPGDYEILFVDVDEGEGEASMRRLIEASAAAGVDPKAALVWFPRNGRTSDELLAAVNALLRVRKDDPPGRDERTAAGLAPMQRVRDMAARVASSPINVLIVGECGVGKDVLAQLVHKLSPRDGKPFMALNCAGIAPSLIESELYGYEKGAFTGALSAKVGLLEAANGGTVFLDEVGDMPAAMQASLLRVLEGREVRPIGAVKSRPIDVRFISATNKDLDAAVTRGDFREDLMFRLDVVRLRIPPLRDRRDEIPSLVDTFVTAAWQDTGRKEPPPTISDDARELLVGYRWPGNIRELKNVMERAVALCDGPVITREHLPLERMGETAKSPDTKEMPRPKLGVVAGAFNLPPLADPEKSAERQRIIDALVAANWNQTRAAASLGMPRRTFVSKLDQYGIPRPQKSASGAP